MKSDGPIRRSNCGASAALLHIDSKVSSSKTLKALWLGHYVINVHSQAMDPALEHTCQLPAGGYHAGTRLTA
jgi:hypothetical protein